jgi:hypothetical protein
LQDLRELAKAGSFFCENLNERRKGMSIFSRKTEVQEPLMDHTVYLIDTENVRTVWTLLLDRMTENDKIYVFYTENSGNIKYEDLNGVISSGKNVELIQCHTGKNGLDFQLVSYLGYLIRNNENADYCIISDDSGYDAVIKFWEGRDVDVTRKTAFQVSGKQAKPVKKSIFGVKPKAKASAPKKPKAEQSKAEQPTKQFESKQTVQPQAKPQKSALTQDKPQPKSNSKTIAPAKEPMQDSKLTVNEDDVIISGSMSPETSIPEEPKLTVRGDDVTLDRPTIESKLSILLPDEPADRIVEIADIIRKAGGKKGLADIHDEIEKLYRNEKGPEIYRKIRQNLGNICASK